MSLVTGIAFAAAGLTTLEVYTHTRNVEAIATEGDTLWAATTGGLEQIRISDPTQRRSFGVAEGLNDAHVVALQLEGEHVTADTPTHRCTRDGERFSCLPRSDPWQPELAAAPRFAGARVTQKLRRGDDLFIATAGAGLWKDGPEPIPMTRSGEICTNHATALEVFDGRLWIGGFDDGLCIRDGDAFETVPTPFRMVNDLHQVDGVLWIAAGEGVFQTTDGHAFTRVDGIASRGANGIASTSDAVWISTPAVLYRVDRRRGRVQATWLPADSRAMQKVRASSDAVWVASEDRGAFRWSAPTTTVFDRAAGMPSSWALDVEPLPDGRIAVGTLRDGVVLIETDGSMTSIPALAGTWVLDVTYANGTLWVGTQSGAYRVDGEHVEALPGLPNPNVHRIFATDEGMWLATEAGLALSRREG